MRKQKSEREREVAIAAYEIRLIMAKARVHLDAGYSNVELQADEDICISESMDG